MSGPVPFYVRSPQPYTFSVESCRKPVLFPTRSPFTPDTSFLSLQCSMPSCVTAFHVTCAFDHGLEMRTILADNDEVKFKSFCQEHSDGGPRGESTSEPVEPSQAGEDLEKVTLRKQRLQQLEEDFYELVEPAEVAERLDLAEALVDFIYQYWKLKRKANANQPLLTPKTDEVDNLAQQEQDVLYRRLKLFTHLRQDLERVSGPGGPSPVVLPWGSQDYPSTLKSSKGAQASRSVTVWR